MEIWKDIPNSRYQVSNLGQVRSTDYYYQDERTINNKVVTRNICRKGKILKPAKMGGNNKWNNNQGQYLAVNIYYNNEKNSKLKYVHKLVAEVFLPNPNGFTEVDHINEDKLDNRAENLRWISHKQNVQYGNAKQKGKPKVHCEEVARGILEYNKFKDNAKRYRAAMTNLQNGNIETLKYYKKNHKKEITQEFIDQMESNISQLKQKKKQLTKLVYISKADYLNRRAQ